MFGLKPLLGLEPMAPIRPQLLVSHANHSATETSCLYVCMYVGVYVYMCLCVFVCVCVYVCICIYVCMSVCMYVTTNQYSATFTLTYKQSKA